MSELPILEAHLGLTLGELPFSPFSMSPHAFSGFSPARVFPTFVLSGFDPVSFSRLALFLEVAWFLYSEESSTPLFFLEADPLSRDLSPVEGFVCKDFVIPDRLAVIVPSDGVFGVELAVFLSQQACVPVRFVLPDLRGFDFAFNDGLVPWPYVLLSESVWFRRFLATAVGSYRVGISEYASFFRGDARFRSGSALLMADDFQQALSWAWALFRMMGVPRISEASGWSRLLSRLSAFKSSSLAGVSGHVS